MGLFVLTACSKDEPLTGLNDTGWEDIAGPKTYGRNYRLSIAYGSNNRADINIMYTEYAIKRFVQVQYDYSGKTIQWHIDDSNSLLSGIWYITKVTDKSMYLEQLNGTRRDGWFIELHRTF